MTFYTMNPLSRHAWTKSHLAVWPIIFSLLPSASECIFTLYANKETARAGLI